MSVGPCTGPEASFLHPVWKWCFMSPGWSLLIQQISHVINDVSSICYPYWSPKLFSSSKYPGRVTGPVRSFKTLHLFSFLLLFQQIVSFVFLPVEEENPVSSVYFFFYFKTKLSLLFHRSIMRGCNTASVGLKGSVMWREWETFTLQPGTDLREELEREHRVAL